MKAAASSESRAADDRMGAVPLAGEEGSSPGLLLGAASSNDPCLFLLFQIASTCGTSGKPDRLGSSAGLT